MLYALIIAGIAVTFVIARHEKRRAAEDDAHQLAHGDCFPAAFSGDVSDWGGPRHGRGQ